MYNTFSTRNLFCRSEFVPTLSLLLTAPNATLSFTFWFSRRKKSDDKTHFTHFRAFVIVIWQDWYAQIKSLFETTTLMSINICFKHCRGSLRKLSHLHSVPSPFVLCLRILQGSHKRNFHTYFYTDWEMCRLDACIRFRLCDSKSV